jgi:hypothetical protein
LTHRNAEQRFQIEHLGEEAKRLLILLLRHLVDVFEEIVRFTHWDVPEQLGALSKDGADVQGVFLSLRIRYDAVDTHLARSRRKNAGQHFYRRGLACAVCADVAYDLTFLNLKINLFDCLLRLVLTFEQRFDCTCQTGVPFDNLIFLRQPANFNHDDPSKCTLDIYI